MSSPSGASLIWTYTICSGLSTRDLLQGPTEVYQWKESSRRHSSVNELDQLLESTQVMDELKVLPLPKRWWRDISAQPGTMTCQAPERNPPNDR